jgi:serine O-acetyltransferase
MEDRGYVAQALFDRLRANGIAFRALGDCRGFPDTAPEEIEIAVPRRSLAGMPRLLARFCQDFDLRLVELSRPEIDAWRGMLAWSDDIGRPRFMAARLLGDYYRGQRRLLESKELLDGAAEAMFARGLLDAVERQSLTDEDAAWLATLWQEDSRGAMESTLRFWPHSAQQRLIGQAARLGQWSTLRSSLPTLRRALRLTMRPRLVFRMPGFLRNRPAVAFTGREGPLRSKLMVHVQGQLAPLRLTMFEGEARRADFRVVFDAPRQLGREVDNVVVIPKELALGAMVAEAERAILRWLECRVERLYPDAMVGENPVAARVLQFAVRSGFAAPIELVLNCRVECRIGSPILMPVPFGIVIERGVAIGRRVTIMHQVTIGRKDPGPRQADGGGVPVIEDNVFIGAGAKVLGAVRIGRGATVGANAVVTRDVPSHCTVVGTNRILGADEPGVAARRREEEDTVVNT